MTHPYRDPTPKKEEPHESIPRGVFLLTAVLIFWIGLTVCGILGLSVALNSGLPVFLTVGSLAATLLGTSALTCWSRWFFGW